MELVDITDLKSVDLGRAGSSPAVGTKKKLEKKHFRGLHLPKNGL